MNSALLGIPKPKKKSHKGQNGIVLIVGGSKTYHGAPILAALAAVRFCDLVYFASTKENNELMRKMKGASPNIIAVPQEKSDFAFSHATCVLVGNGMDADAATKKMAEKILKTKKRCVLDAAALRVVDAKLLHSNAIVTPHVREFQSLFGIPANEKNAASLSKRYNCTILLKGERDIVASCGKVVHVKGGNAGMTKGGTGDVLAGLLAAIYSRTESPLSAAYTASYLNKKAGEMLFRCFGYNFSSEDLAGELAFVAASLSD
ncbi:MAG: NAD(P)H-hydrate dehydratase [Candidatus Anstonellaceae archaeon]